MELVHQRRFDIIEELGAHDVSRSGASPFRDITKRIRELLSKVEALDCLYYERESPRIYRERSAISRNTVEIVQISTLLEKQKRFISICYIIS